MAFPPFWDENYTTANPGPYVGPVYQSNPWDTAFILGRQVPGIVSVAPVRQRHLWIWQAPKSPPNLVIAGYEPVRFTMTIRLWTPAQWAAMEFFYGALQTFQSIASLPHLAVTQTDAQGNATATNIQHGGSIDPNKAFDVYHPLLDAMKIRSVVCERFGELQGEQVKTLALGFLNYTTQTSKLSKIKSSDVADPYNADTLPNQTVNASDGATTTYAPTQGPQQPPSQGGISLVPTP